MAAETKFVQYLLVHQVGHKDALELLQFTRIQAPQKDVHAVHHRKPHAEKITVILLE